MAFLISASVAAKFPVSGVSRSTSSKYRLHIFLAWGRYNGLFVARPVIDRMFQSERNALGRLRSSSWPRIISFWFSDATRIGPKDTPRFGLCLDRFYTATDNFDPR